MQRYKIKEFFENYEFLKNKIKEIYPDSFFNRFDDLKKEYEQEKDEENFFKKLTEDDLKVIKAILDINETKKRLISGTVLKILISSPTHKSNSHVLDNSDILKRKKRDEQRKKRDNTRKKKHEKVILK